MFERPVDAVVVGAGPNGLAAAITLSRAGRHVGLIEAGASVGGGTRSAELTLPGYIHDVCSSVHPLAAVSPVFRGLPLQDHGLEWIYPMPLAHPFDDGTAAILSSSMNETAASLGDDGPAYLKLMRPVVESFDELLPQLLAPLRLPKHPLSLARFGLHALRSAEAVGRRFTGQRAGGLFAGLGAHSQLRLDERPSAAVALVLAAVAHTAGWPIPRGGSQRIADALAAHLRSLGGEIVVGRPMTSLDELPRAPALLLDLTPRQVLEAAGTRLPRLYRAQLGRYRYGPGVFKIDFALAEPIPWTAKECARASTVHLGGTANEIAAAEAAVGAGETPERPCVLVTQPTLFDPTRAPDGNHIAWAYCHVPNASRVDMTARIEAQIERFAPGFGECVLARHIWGPRDLERYNANYIGGDINGGKQDLRQLFVRPTIRLDPYATPDRRLYICSASTPPGGGVHGMCGYHAARSALRRASW